MISRRQISSFSVSAVVHVGVVIGMLSIAISQSSMIEDLPIESLVKRDKPDPLEMIQKLDTQKTAATTLNTTAGSVSAKAGGNSKAIKTEQKIVIPKDAVKTVNISFTPSDVPQAGAQMLQQDLGEGEILGSPQMLVRGYGPALDQLTKELIRMMRKNKLLVVWLFDESESMKDDQQEIKGRIGRVFKELQIVDREAEKIGISKKIRKSRRGRSLLKEIMATSITSYGQAYSSRTKVPTADLKTILQAIDKIPIDKSGKENTCAALIKAINQHKYMAARQKRKLVLVVISDESGDDGLAIDNVVRQARIMKAPIYVLGRESVFGSLYAHVTWRQPETGRIYYLPIRRGPETPFAELMQHDGFRRRHDSHMSGFGPYDQVRMCRETGGIFFQLPYEQENLNDFEAKQYASLRLREYLPDLTSRTAYVQARDRSPFRRAIWEVIAMLNPYNKQVKGIELPDPRYQWFTTNPAQFGPEVAKRGKQILAMLKVFDRAIYHLNKVKYLQTKEPSRRWRANYDLILAQLHWYQLRLFEYGIGMDQFVRKGMKANPKHNRWMIRETSRNLVLPDEVNQKRFKITREGLKDKKKYALARLADVAEKHPGTPYAERAKWEMRRPFGVTFRTYYQPPPKPGKSRPRPKPTTPPKL